MKTTMEFLDELLKPSECKMQLPNDKWVNVRPIEFQYGIATAEFWRELRHRAVGGWAVLRGRADAIEKR